MTQIDTKGLLRRLLSLPYDASTKPAYGMPDIGTNSDLRDAVYSSFTAGEKTQIRDIFLSSFSEEHAPKRILAEFPRSTKELPRVILWRTGETEARGALGQVRGTEDEDEDEDVEMTYGSILSETHEIHVWAKTSALMRDVLYLAVRFLLLRGKRWLHDQGLLHVVFRQGRDGQMADESDASQGAEIIHQATITVECETEVSWTIFEPKPETLEGSVVDSRTGSGEFTADRWEDER